MLSLCLLTACALPEGTPGVAAPTALPAPGTGTLRQDEVSVPLVSGDLQIKVTPLAESVTRTTAPDTYRRLSGLAGRYGPEAVRRSGFEHPTLFLVSFYSESPDVAFVPEEIQVISQGTRFRPATILSVTPGWGQRRLAQRETEMAVYVFDGQVDLESSLIVVYGLVESSAWNAILPRVRAERARASARGGG
jgi:hypothetical protein